MNKFSVIKAITRQRGFTLLELLVVVAILAAIAGTAAIALQDTDARASAAAHVAMMDELNKGIRTFRVLQRNQYPDAYDSIMQVDQAPGDDGAIVSGKEVLGVAGFETGVAEVAVLATFIAAGETAPGDTMVARLAAVGITRLRVASTVAGADPEDDGDCANHEALIASRGNAVVAGNIFMSPAAGGCGGNHAIAVSTSVLLWRGGTERITGTPVPEKDFDGTNFSAATVGLPVMMMVGLGPNSTLFDVGNIGGMTTVPVYRHVAITQYNRFIALFRIAVTNGTANPTVTDQVLLMAIVDGAGDTKEEELGEWDGTRNTI